MRERGEIYDTFWTFAHKRLGIYLSRARGAGTPWTEDRILSTYRFTNVYRVADRVSQYLVREVQYGNRRSQAPDELFFRTLLFKFFNRIETWELLEEALDSISWQSADFNRIGAVLDEAFQKNKRLYSAAYIMPSPSFGHVRKHANHLALLDRMMKDGLPARLVQLKSLREVYLALLPYPGLGRFLAFQYTIDLNYSSMLTFEEDDFVVAGPGALDGIAKCFEDIGNAEPEEVIMEMVDRQDDEFRRLDLPFEGLFGRRLQPIDIQNLFCEISKYTRVSHPEVVGASGRTRIKQSFEPSDKPFERPYFPPRWKLAVPEMAAAAPPRQPQLAF
jgi:hypothetical protein